MNAPELLFPRAAAATLPDVQASADRRGIAIQKVGVRDVRYPVRVRAAGGVAQSSVGVFQMTVALPPEVKGTHMSRFIEVLEGLEHELDAQALGGLLDAMLSRLQADAGSISLRTTWFRRKTAPVSGVASLLDYGVRLEAEHDGTRRVLRQTVEVPVTSLCPCSRDISAYGAHNQRSLISIGAELRGALELDEQIGFAEDAASCQLWDCSSAPTRSTSPSTPTTTRSSSRIWCATSRWRCARTPGSPRTPWPRRTSSPSTTIPPTLGWKGATLERA